MKSDMKFVPGTAEPWDNTPKKGGFEPLEPSEFAEPCISPSHNPPTHLYIPPGQQYRHVCPCCGMEVVMRPTQIRW
jgi:hypothetical protein